MSRGEKNEDIKDQEPDDATSSTQEEFGRNSGRIPQKVMKTLRSTKRPAVESLIDNGLAAMVTSPPYIRGLGDQQTQLIFL